MRAVPERPTGLTLGALIGSFVVGPFAGLQLGAYFAPGSELAQAASVLAFPAALFAGLAYWFGFGVVAVVIGALANLVRGRIPAAADLTTAEALVPPGYGAFVFFSVAFCSGAALLAWLLSDATLLQTLCVYAATGGVYGFGLWTLAHNGYLPFPEPG